MTRHVPRVSVGEKTLFVAGVVLLGAIVAEMVVLFVLARPLGEAALQGLAAEIVAGREGGVPVGLNAGVPPVMMWQISWHQDLTGAFLVYPVFLHMLHVQQQRKDLLWDRLMELTFQRQHGLAPRGAAARMALLRLGLALTRRVDRLQAASMRHERSVQRWGVAGLVVFMLVPFLVNGPLIALILGRLIGIHTRTLVLPVVLGTMLTAALWVAFFDTMLNLVNAVDPRFGTLVAVGAVLVVVGLAVWDVVRERGVPIADDGEE